MEGNWSERSRRCLEAAESLLQEGYSAQSIEMAWLSMSCAVRGLLARLDPEWAKGVDLPVLYEERLLPRLRISPENRRAFTIICHLRDSVFVSGEEAGDPLTARACLEDAACFLRELEEVTLSDIGSDEAYGEKKTASLDPSRESHPADTAMATGPKPLPGQNISLEELAKLLLRMREEQGG